MSFWDQVIPELGTPLRHLVTKQPDILAEDSDALFIHNKKYVFKSVPENKMQTILEQKDKVNTQKATQSAVSQFKAYLRMKKLLNIMSIDLELPASTLRSYYVELRPQNDENYSVQSLKFKRAALNRFFKPNRGIDIILDTEFTRANKMFKGVLVQYKKSGKGVKHSYPKIIPEDMNKIILHMTTWIHQIQRSYKGIYCSRLSTFSVDVVRKICMKWEKRLSELLLNQMVLSIWSRTLTKQIKITAQMTVIWQMRAACMVTHVS